MTEVRGIAGRDEMTGLAQNPLLVRPALRRFMTKGRNVIHYGLDYGINRWRVLWSDGGTAGIIPQSEAHHAQGQEISAAAYRTDKSQPQQAP